MWGGEGMSCCCSGGGIQMAQQGGAVQRSDVSACSGHEPYQFVVVQCRLVDKGASPRGGGGKSNVQVVVAECFVVVVVVVFAFAVHCVVGALCDNSKTMDKAQKWLVLLKNKNNCEF